MRAPREFLVLSYEFLILNSAVPLTQNSTFKTFLDLPRDESPARGDVIGHVERLFGLRVADAADRDHPVEKFRIPGLADLLDRVIRQRSAFSLAQNLQQLMVEARVDLADARRAGEMRQAAGREDRDALFPSLGDLADQLADLETAARRRDRLDPRVDVDRQNGNFRLREQKMQRHGLRVLQLDIFAEGKIDAGVDAGFKDRAPELFVVAVVKAVARELSFHLVGERNEERRNIIVGEVDELVVGDDDQDVWARRFEIGAQRRISLLGVAAELLLRFE